MTQHDDTIVFENASVALRYNDTYRKPWTAVVSVDDFEYETPRRYKSSDEAQAAGMKLALLCNAKVVK